MKSPDQPYLCSLFLFVFPWCCDKCFDKKNLWEEGFSFAQEIQQGSQGNRSSKHLVTSIHEQKAMKHAAARFSSSILFNPGPQVQGMVLPTFKIGLSTPVKGIKLTLPQASPGTLFYSLPNWQLTLTITSLYRRLPPNPAPPIPLPCPYCFFSVLMPLTYMLVHGYYLLPIFPVPGILRSTKAGVFLEDGGGAHL